MNSKPDTDIISAFKNSIEQELYKASVDLIDRFCKEFEEKIINRRNAAVANILDAIEIEILSTPFPDRIELQMHISSSPGKEKMLKKKIIALEAEIEELQEENAELRRACEDSGCPRSNY